MHRYDDPVWRRACLQTEPFVWEARGKWAEAARRWIEGSGNIDEVLEAANGFGLSVEAAAAQQCNEPHSRMSEKERPASNRA